MRANRWLPPLVAFLLMAATCPAAGPTRTWTDRHGRTTTGKFVRLDEGQVVILRGGKPLVVPLESLSDEDQEYVLAQGKGKDRGKKEDGTAATDPAPAAGTVPAPPNPFDPDVEQTWTDIRGQTIKAQFVRVEQGQVILRKGGKELSFPFAHFSPTDQQRIRGLVGDDAELLAPGPPGRLARPDFPPPISAFPGGADDQAQRNREELEGAATLADDYRRAGEQFVAAAQEEAARQQAAREEAARGPEFPPPPQVPQGPGPMPSFQPPAIAPSPNLGGPPVPTGPMFQEVFHCSKCGKEVPSTIKAGERCPHCGVYFGYKQGASGEREYAKGFPFTRGGAAWGGLIGGAVAVIAFLFRALMRR